ncbi:MAG: preprotein translocase subunit SecG [Pseudomonadota bacterium]|jgi:preprotein translocase subunit SecG|nr:preprotein translocase subunit SecG [Pseudomonadota bacterium]
MQPWFLGLHILIALTLIGLILLQHGKGADVGAAFGSGASSTIFGARGSASFLSRATAILAFLFFSNCFFLGYLASTAQQKSLMERIQVTPKDEKSAGGVEVQDIQVKKVEPQDQTSDLPAVPRPESEAADVPPAPAQAGAGATEDTAEHDTAKKKKVEETKAKPSPPVSPETKNSEAPAKPAAPQ